MRISALSTANTGKYGFQDEKVSLRKLSQVKALNNVQYYQQQRQSQVKPYQIVRSQMKAHYNIQQPQQKQSHIQWAGGCCGSGDKSKQLLNSNQYHNQILSQTGKFPRRTTRRKIFDHQSKQDIHIPTFSNVPQSPYQQQTGYYSMIVSPPKQQFTSSPFITNIQNINHHLAYNNNTPISYQSRRGFQRQQSISSLTAYHIPKLQRRLQQHDQQLTTIRKYLENAQKLSELKDSIKEFQQVEVMRIKHEEIKNKRLMIMNEIAQAKLREKEVKVDQQVGYRIRYIEEERIRRLERMKRENQQLKHDLTQRDYQLPAQYNTKRDENHYRHQPPQSEQYRFQGPIAFPSKDWDSQQDIQQLQMGKSFERSDNSKGTVTYRRGYYKADLQVSSALKKKMNEISSIGFTNNKGESFSLQANTFRDFTSPLDFQGENQPW